MLVCPNVYVVFLLNRRILSRASELALFDGLEGVLPEAVDFDLLRLDELW